MRFYYESCQEFLMTDPDDDLKRWLDVTDRDREAFEADKAPKRKPKKQERDFGPPLDRDQVMAKVGRAVKKDELARFRSALKGVEVNFLKRVSWVANNLGAQLSDFADDEPPDFASIKQLDWANENEALFRQLYDSKLMPTKNELASAERSKDDGRALTLLDDFEKQFHAERTAGFGGERQVSPAGNQTREREQDGEG